MPPRTKTGSRELGDAIREQRTVLGLTIEDAAARANVGAKSWGRYEAGQAIRSDKVRGVWRALGWTSLPTSVGDETDSEAARLRTVSDEHEAWSESLQEFHGRACAITFAVGSDLLIDHAREDLESLSREPRGTHIGQLGHSWFVGDLPAQFLPRYDYDFMYSLLAAGHALRKRARHGHLVAYTVLEEIALYLIFGEGEMFAEMDPDLFKNEDWRGWVGEILGDLDLVWLLYSSTNVLIPADGYHFDKWLEHQFWTSGEDDGEESGEPADIGHTHAGEGD